jgi:hypothetical protein
MLDLWSILFLLLFFALSLLIVHGIERIKD